MTRKERMDLLLSKVAEDQKEAFVADLRTAKSKEDRTELFKKYNVVITEEEAADLKEKNGTKLSDEELDAAAGGCVGVGTCNCNCDCSCS